MFKFLKKAVEKFTKKVEKEEKVEDAPKEEPKPEPVPKELKKLEEKKTWLDRVTATITEAKLTEGHFDRLFSALETELLQNNVAYGVVEKIKVKLQTDLVGKSLKRNEIVEIIRKDLKELILDIFETPKPIDLLTLAKETKPLVILFVGVNGVGKTTNMAKLAKWLQSTGLSCVFAASDTFRAAAIEQLEFHANKLGVPIIKHKYGADPAAVAFDAIKHATAKKLDVVLIDTAGRSHANADLMDEMAKIKRVNNPHITILVVDALTGNDAVEQANKFDDKIGIDGSILSKVDADEKGGALISVAYATKKPILFLGTGQTYDDLQKFDAEKIIEKLI